MDEHITAKKEFVDFKSRVRESANKIIQNLPQKIYNTSELWKDVSIHIQTASNEIVQSQGWETRAVPCNEALVSILQRLKNEVESVLEMLRTLKLHFTLSMPEKRIRVSFNTEVEREILQELKMASAAARLILRTLSHYPALRAAVLNKAMKTPNFEDSRRAVVEHDFLQGLNVHKWLRDLQHLHTLLNDLINKNHKSLKSLQVPFRYKGGNTLTTTTTTTAAEGGTHRSVHSRRRTCGGLKDEENSDDDDDGFSSLFG